MDEMFDDMDASTYTLETTHSIEDLGYGATRYARVASTSGEGDAMLMSMWTTHTTGMSAGRAAAAAATGAGSGRGHLHGAVG